MNKRKTAAAVTGTVFLFLIIVSLVLMLFSITPFLFGKSIMNFIGVFLIISVISYSVLIISLLNDKEMPQKLFVTLKTVVIIICVLLVLFGSVLSLFFAEKTIKRDVSFDKRHEVIVETESVGGGWYATLYRRYTPFFKHEMKSFYINDMASSDAKVSVVWYDDGCDVTYECYSDFSTSSEPETFTQRLYFSDKTE